jgi:hypothetical protein
MSPFRKNSTGAIILDVQLEDILDEKNLFNEEELRKSKELCAEEAMLRKEIHELETTEIEVNIILIYFCIYINVIFTEKINDTHMCQVSFQFLSL